MTNELYEWDEEKEKDNITKHGISFTEAAKAFLDERMIIKPDSLHSEEEERYFGLGRVGAKILTVRFTYRNGRIRIYGAAEWRKGRKTYEKENKKI